MEASCDSVSLCWVRAWTEERSEAANKISTAAGDQRLLVLWREAALPPQEQLVSLHLAHCLVTATSRSIAIPFDTTGACLGLGSRLEATKNLPQCRHERGSDEGTK